MNQLSKEFARRARGNQPYDGFIIYKLQHKLVGGGPMPPVKRKTKAVRATSKLTHLDERGRVRMVDVGEKPVTRREAVARGAVTMAAATLEVIVGGRLAKGEALAAARIAGIMAAKRTHELIPLCHQLPLESVEVDFHPDLARATLEIQARAVTTARTGVEMEALVAVSAAALTIYDMAKAIDRAMVMGGVRLIRKSGGRSGEFIREGERAWS
jgi:cyclic pyranopterin phosphate synthase